MAAKTKALPGGMHTAGLFSDMTLDGPDIGTLVVIVDRAKNLPNRKTIGKQDPYCAARLGKEARKTSTDRRGGQTPRWDQELRFPVHDSPDYYQLKVSVFNDDKKTDLIGETWVNLSDVVVPGGGQNDVWHSLNFRGKYAGEIRIEITYYDSRPKQEKAADKARQMQGEDAKESARDGLSGPRQPKPVKRRPLPADPVAPSAAAAQPVQDIHTSPQGYPTQSFIKKQSPLQSLEQDPYHTPSPLRVSQPRGSATMPPYQGSLHGVPNGALPSKQSQDERRDYYDQPSPNSIPYYAGPNHYDERPLYDSYNSQSAQTLSHSPNSPYEYASQDSHRPPLSPTGPPPPPPAHRSSHNSPAAPHLSSHNSYGFNQGPSAHGSQFNTPTEDYRQSVPAYPGQQLYQPYNPRQETHEMHMEKDAVYSPSKQTPYDDHYHANYAAMQPSVEDAPPSPSIVPRRDSFMDSQVVDSQYRDVPSPAPLNLNGRSSGLSGHSSVSSALSYPTTSGYSVASATSYGESISSYQNSSMSRRSQYAPSMQSCQSTELVRRNSEDPNRDISDYGTVALPNSLVAGMDPDIAREISDRIYQDRRGTSNGTTRGRNPDPPSYRPVSRGNQYEAPMSVFVPAASSYDERHSRHATGTIASTVKPRAVSPDTRTIPRKSVSPSPVPTEERRLSGVPFGPDSYNALNPSLSSGAPGYSANTTGDTDDKIIMHDGTEVDPSDHLPRDSWAPEPEKKGPKYASQMPDQSPLRSRVPAQNSQPPSTGRRQLRVAGRPHSMTVTATSYTNPVPMPDPSTPPARNRLQKKGNRASTMVTPTGTQSSPLAPVSPHHDNYSGFTPKPLGRSHTSDLENYSPSSSHYGSGSGYRNSVAGPPIPAKVPMNAGPPSTAEAWTLLEEMKSIDLGVGGSARSRRRRY